MVRRVAVVAVAVLAVLLVLLVLPGWIGSPAAFAGRDQPVVDKQAGTVTVTGAAAADLRAPGPDIARVAAERIARQRADQRLRAAVRSLARGVADGDPRLSAPLAQATARVRYSSDGSVEVDLSLPLSSLGSLSPPKKEAKPRRWRPKRPRTKARSVRSPWALRSPSSWIHDSFRGRE